MSAYDDILAARYALGVADGDEMAAAEARMQEDRAFAARIARYQASFDTLHDDTAELKPRDGLWELIDAAIDDEERIKAPRSVHPKDIPWQAIAPNLDRKIIYHDRQAGIQMVLYRAGPGAIVECHRNHINEECLVLEGEIEIGDQTLKAGEMQIVLAGTMHSRITSRNGAIIYIREGVSEA